MLTPSIPVQGFLSEDAQFAEICEAHEVTFIGPTAENLRTMGDKAEARETMSKAGLEVGARQRQRPSAAVSAERLKRLG